MKGFVRKFEKQKGFGFIRPEGESDDVFFHINDVLESQFPIVPGAMVEFEVVQGQKGPRATHVNVKKVPKSPHGFYLCAAILLSAFIFCLLRFYSPASSLVSYLIAVSLSTLFLIGYDKGIAGGSSPRVPEAVLHTLTFLGGGPGVILGMNMFRHKTRKKNFHFVIGFIIILQFLLIQYFIKASKQP